MLESFDTKASVISNPIPSMVRSIADAIVIKDQNLFLITQKDGSIPSHEKHGFGLYYNDCRYLSAYTLEIGNTRPSTLVSNATMGFMAVSQMCNEEFKGTDGTPIQKEQLGIKWRRVIDAETLTLDESLTFQNFSLNKMIFEISLLFDATFEDVFIVRGMSRNHGGGNHSEWNENTLSFVYEGQDHVFRSLFIDFTLVPIRREGGRASFQISVEPQGKQDIAVSLSVRESASPPAIQKKVDRTPNLIKLEKNINEKWKKWLTLESKIESDSQSLNRTIVRSMRDLRTLQSSHSGRAFFSAGVPWFATLFGRDCLITALQTLAYNPKIAEETLRLLAETQGKKQDEWKDEAPGKILHELRVGELAATGEIPHTPYYGTVDATPLFLVLLVRHAQWTGNLSLFHELKESVELALAWMEQYGDIDKDGYLKYSSQSSHGLVNQGWKDSWDGIVNANGSLAAPPIALVEVQGYVYDAKLGIAFLYERCGNKDKAEKLRKEANALKERFNREFWLKDQAFYALALQAGNEPAQVIASNPGHALWSGIAEYDKAEMVMTRLLRDDMFSGWGIRTLSEKEKRYNPLGYHLGTVWPHDNSIIAAGFKRYGFNEAALTVFNGIFRSSVYFQDHRLPELFAGFSETDYGVPVPYPVACHPQAWASGTIPYLIVTLLGLVPEAFSKRIRIVCPVLPSFVDRLEIRDLKIGNANLDIGFYRTQRGRVAVEVLKEEGPIDVVVEPNFHAEL